MSVQEFKATHLYRVMDLGDNVFRLEPIMIFEGRGYSESDWYGGSHAILVFENGWRQVVPGNPDFKWYVEPLITENMEPSSLAVLDLAASAIASATDLLGTLIRSEGDINLSVRGMCASTADLLEHISHHIQEDIASIVEMAPVSKFPRSGPDGTSGEGE